MRSALLLATLLVTTVAHASETVAVMPFNDLSSSSGTVGEAIRETVTSDLRELSGLRVIERSKIDQIVSEQKLQAKRSDLDPATTVRVGKLLGAGLMVTGAYQKVGPEVRLTARFVRVETGEIIGTAKVDGAAAELLSLQDRVTAALLKSAGFANAAIERFAKRTRPKIHSVRTFELYGDAVVEHDDDKRKQLLEKALAEEPTFVYASRDLDALKQRLAGYDKSARKETNTLIDTKLHEIARLKDPDKINMAYNQIFGLLTTQRRFRRMLVEAQAVLRHPPPKPQAGIPSTVEMAGFEIVLSHSVLHHHDAVLQTGEAFLRDHKTSVWFDGVRNLVDQSIASKREAAAAAADAAPMLTSGMDPCTLVDKLPIRAYAQRRPFLETCIQQGGTRYSSVPQLEARLINTCQELGDFACAHAALERLRTLDQKQFEREEQISRFWPVDE